MGQGLFIKVAQVVAEEFGVGLDKVKITATTTAKVPEHLADRRLLRHRPQRAWRRSTPAARSRSGSSPSSRRSGTSAASASQFRDGQGADRQPRDRPCASSPTTAYVARIPLSATGFYKTPKITWDREKATGRPFYYFAYGAACSEVTIDTMTGEMRVDRVDILHDVGKSLNPAIDIGQIEGGFVQGMGWLTTEELVWDSAGRLRTHAPSTYKIPTASDVPADFRVALFESGGNREETIYRSKAVGEPPLMLAISVFSAITDAIASLKPAVDAAPRRAGDAGGDHAGGPRHDRGRDLMTRLAPAPRRDRSPRAGGDGYGRRHARLDAARGRRAADRHPGRRHSPARSAAARSNGGRSRWPRRRSPTPASRAPRLRRFALGPELGQCCGGQVELAIEVFDRTTIARGSRILPRARPPARSPRVGRIADGQASSGRWSSDPVDAGTASCADGVLSEGFGDDRRPLFLFGAGHVGRALVLALAPLPFAVTWIDPRPDAFPAYHARQRHAVRRLDDPTAAFADAPAGELRPRHDPQPPARSRPRPCARSPSGRFPYVGLIGSASKRARFERRLGEAGIPRERIAEPRLPDRHRRHRSQSAGGDRRGNGRPNCWSATKRCAPRSAATMALPASAGGRIG